MEAFLFLLVLVVAPFLITFACVQDPQKGLGCLVAPLVVAAYGFWRLHTLPADPGGCGMAAGIICMMIVMSGIAAASAALALCVRWWLRRGSSHEGGPGLSPPPPETT